MIFVRYINSFAKVMIIANKSDIGLTNYAMYNLHFYTCIVQKLSYFCIKWTNVSTNVAKNLCFTTYIHIFADSLIKS